MNQSQEMMQPIIIDAQQDAQEQLFNYFESAVCIEGNKCNQVCCTKQCKANAIVCIDRNCKCYKMHYNEKICSLVHPKFIIEKIQQKRKNSPQLFNFFDEDIQKLIDYISQFRDKMEKKVKSLRLTKNMREFLQISKNMQFKELTGQTVSKVFKQLNKYSKNSKQFADNLQKELYREWNYVEKGVKRQFYSLENFIDYFLKQPFNDSKVLSTQKQMKKLVNFFPQYIRNFQSKLIYRASENQFSIRSFHQKCYDIPHTVTLVKTQFNKVIGGYTPLTWKGKIVKYKTYQQDESWESFLFSITNNHKFTINQYSESQICHFKQCGPIFCHSNGSTDLMISGKEEISVASIGSGYLNQRYRYEDKQLQHYLFTGQNDGKFKILEWQVYQLKF